MVSTTAVPNTSLETPASQVSLLDHFEEGVLLFVDVKDKPNITIELVKSITDSKDEMMRGKKKCKAKKKTQLHALIRTRVASFATSLSSRPGSLAHESFLRSFAPLSSLGSPVFLSFGLRSSAPTSCLRSLNRTSCFQSPVSTFCLV